MATAVSEIRKNITAEMRDKDTEDGEMLQDYLDIIITIFSQKFGRYYSLEVLIKTQKIRKMLQGYVDIIVTMCLRNSERKTTRR